MIVDIMFNITLPLKIMKVINIDLFEDGIELYNSNLIFSLSEYYELWSSKSERFRKKVIDNLKNPQEYIININNKCKSYKQFLDRKNYLFMWLYS